MSVTPPKCTSCNSTTVLTSATNYRDYYFWGCPKYGKGCDGGAKHDIVDILALVKTLEKPCPRCGGVAKAIKSRRRGKGYYKCSYRKCSYRAPLVLTLKNSLVEVIEGLQNRNILEDSIDPDLFPEEDLLSYLIDSRKPNLKPPSELHIFYVVGERHFTDIDQALKAASEANVTVSEEFWLETSSPLGGSSIYLRVDPNTLISELPKVS